MAFAAHDVADGAHLTRIGLDSALFESLPNFAKICRRPSHRQATADRGAGGSLDEQHLRVLGQRPEVVGHYPLEAVCDLADVFHRGHHPVVHVGRPLLR